MCTNACVCGNSVIPSEDEHQVSSVPASLMSHLSDVFFPPVRVHHGSRSEEEMDFRFYRISRDSCRWHGQGLAFCRFEVHPYSHGGLEERVLIFCLLIGTGCKRGTRFPAIGHWSSWSVGMQRDITRGMNGVNRCVFCLSRFKRQC